MKKILMLSMLFLAACAPARQSKPFTFEDGARLFVLKVDEATIKSEGNEFLYKNEDFQLTTRINAKEISFTFVNTGKSVERFIWEDSAIVMPDGRTSRLGNGEVSWLTRNNPIPTAVIPQNAKYEEFIYPMSNLEFDDGLILKPMFAQPLKTVTNIRLLLSLEINAQKVQKEFTFTATPMSSEPPKAQ